MNPGRFASLVVLLGLLSAACGAGDGVGTGEGSGDGDDGALEDGGPFSGLGDVDASGVGPGQLTQTADPGSAWIEVEGARTDFTPSGTRGFECTVGPDMIHAQFIVGDANGLDIDAVVQVEGFTGSLTFRPEGTTIAYNAPIQVGTLGLDGQSISWEGTVEKVEGFDLDNRTEHQARVAVNCGLQGQDPTAVIGGTTIVVPMNEASITCEVSDDAVDISISNTPARTSIQISATQDADGWSGVVGLSSEQDLYTATVDSAHPLSVDGGTVSFEGTFTHTIQVNSDLNEELEGSATATCS